MPARPTPYGAFNFLVEINGDAEFGNPMGGFSDVSGLSTEVTVAEYRNGNDPENHVHKVPGVHKVGDVTLKRGIVNSAVLWQWIDETRKTGVRAQRTVVITLRDETHQKVQAWELRGVIPLKYTGPTLAGKGGGDVAMEEVVLSAEKLELQGVTA
jgi:phage tail-like protein